MLQGLDRSAILVYNEYIKSKEVTTMKNLKYRFEDLMMSDLMEKAMLVMAHGALIAGVICLVKLLVKG